MTTFPSRQSIRTKSIVNNSSPHRHRRREIHSNIEPSPSKEQLRRLREILEIKKGSLQYKKRGCGVYHVKYGNDGKYRWTYIGSWTDLKEKIEA